VLTPTDIHHLVGLILLCFEPEDVQVELGDFLFDQAAESFRDVDITIKGKMPCRLVGIEVKSHYRKLDSTHVEQLIQKLKDMPSLTGRGIVSATGFTQPAVRKARAHGVDLYELRPWKNQANTFKWFRSEFVPFSINHLEWVGEVKAQVNPSSPLPAEMKRAFSMQSPVLVNGVQSNEAPTVECLVKNLQSHAHLKLVEITRGTQGHFPLRICVAPTFSAVLVGTHGEMLQVKNVLFEGNMQWVERKAAADCKALFKIGENTPLAGCAVGEIGGLGGFGLVGVVICGGSLHVVNVSNEARLKVKIKNLKLTKNPTSNQCTRSGQPIKR
jgi:hypothetical protein